MKSLFLIILLFPIGLYAQYAPPAGMTGSTAISKDSSIIISWADSVLITRGPMNIAQPDSLLASYGLDENALGPADLLVLSLGDGGTASFHFDPPLGNHPGPDIAIFENSFSDYFLELAFVDLSSDGVNFFTFSAVSLTDPAIQVESYGTLTPELIHNLAGKYRGGFGTPFDFEELADIQGLDINSIQVVRVRDVIGSIQSDFASFDMYGQIINDPWPTAFESGGFDLDALAILDVSLGTQEVEFSTLKLYPQPCEQLLNVEGYNNIHELQLYSPEGKLIPINILGQSKDHLQIDSSDLPDGIYYLSILSDSGYQQVRFIKVS